ncbi:MAG: heparinase II/III family protein [Phycisphaeraceae bacterium]
MLLENVRMEQLADHLAEAGDRPTWPGLHHQLDRDRLRTRAQATGRWDRLTSLATPEPIEVLPRSVFRQYKREGIREPYQRLHDARRHRTEAAAFAVWLKHPMADLDYVQDLLWAWCESATWIIPAHEMHPSNLELGSTRIGRVLSEIAYLLQDDLDPEVYERVTGEIDRRMLDAASDWRRPNRWATRPMNWNHVCNANLIQIALYRIEDPFTLAHFIHPLIQRLDYAIDGFARDGGCLEGPGYWAYGFGHYVDAAIAVHQRTAGQVNLMDDPRVAPICRYPLAVHFNADHRVTVADAGDGYVSADVALNINHLHPLPQLYALTPPRDDNRLDLRDWRSLALDDGVPVARDLSPRDALLPDTGLARIVAGNEPTTQVAITAGHNGVPHNHNDVGSFIYFRHGRAVLTDPGAPRYTRETFGPNRYDLVHCRSLGHSVPVIDGQEQPAGGQYAGDLNVAHMNGGAAAGDAVGPKTAIAEIARAYALPALRSLTRRLELRPDGELRISDAFDFIEPPATLDEGFVTFDDVTVIDGRRAVRFGNGSAAVTVRAADDTAGTFVVRELPESVEHGRDGRLLRRVTFNPATIAGQMTLNFIAC